MPYMYCTACGQNHSQILQRDAVKIAIALLDGDGQIVTGSGVMNLCLLDILGRETQRKVRPSEYTANHG